MSRRARIDLDAVPLTGDHDALMPLAIFRHRTTEGLVLLIPESGEVSVPWSHVEEASVDLVSGRVRLRFAGAWARTQNWLRGTETLTGEWLDRYVWVAESGS